MTKEPCRSRSYSQRRSLWQPTTPTLSPQDLLDQPRDEAHSYRGRQPEQGADEDGALRDVTIDVGLAEPLGLVSAALNLEGHLESLGPRILVHRFYPCVGGVGVTRPA